MLSRLFGWEVVPGNGVDAMRMAGATKTTDPIEVSTVVVGGGIVGCSVALTIAATNVAQGRAADVVSYGLIAPMSPMSPDRSQIPQPTPIANNPCCKHGVRL